MKKLFGILFLFILASCSNDDPSIIETTLENENNFSISGSIQNGQNLKFYLESIDEQGTTTITETKSDGSGKFELEGSIPNFGLYQLRMGDAKDKIIPLTMVPDDHVKIKATFDNFALSPTIEGTKWSSLMTDYMKVYSVFHHAQSQLIKNPEALTNEELTEKFIAYKAPLDSFSIAAMNNDPSNAFNIVLSVAATPSPPSGFDGWDAKNLDLLEKVATAYERNYPNSPLTGKLSGQLYKIKLDYNEYVANNSGTRPAPEIALNNPDGEEIKLSSLQGKYVLIDFWASWCGPCRRENPNVVKLYHQYKNRGFTVFSVSLDDNVAAWKSAIEKDGLQWPNHVSDLLKWNSPLPQLYRFQGIPHTVLINKEGNIIGVGLRGKSLEQKLKEIFTK